MIYYLILPIFALGLVIVQTSLLDSLLLEKMNIEITLLCVIYGGLHFDPLKGCALSFLLGLMLDLMTTPVTGFFTSAYLFVFLMALLVAPRVYKSHVLFVMLFTLAAVLLEMFTLVVEYRMVYGISPWYTALSVYLPQAVLLPLLSPLFFALFGRFEVLYRGGIKQPA